MPELALLNCMCSTKLQSEIELACSYPSLCLYQKTKWHFLQGNGHFGVPVHIHVKCMPCVTRVLINRIFFSRCTPAWTPIILEFHKELCVPTHHFHKDVFCNFYLVGYHYATLSASSKSNDTKTKQINLNH